MHDWILILHLSRPRARACEWNRKGHRFASGNSTQSLHLSLRDNSAGRLAALGSLSTIPYGVTWQQSHFFAKSLCPGKVGFAGHPGPRLG
jgi:hypothetical protein